MKTNLMQYLSSVYFVNQTLHVSGISVAHHQEVYCIYTTFDTCCAFQLTVCWLDGQQTVNWKEQHVPTVVYTHTHTHIIPPDDGLQIFPKHVEVDWRNKLRINNASSWFLLHRYYSTISSWHTKLLVKSLISSQWESTVQNVMFV